MLTNVTIRIVSKARISRVYLYFALDSNCIIKLISNLCFTYMRGFYK